MQKKIVLIDSNALVHRAFHALPPTLSSPQGVPTNAIFGFVSVLIKMLKDLKPDYVAATFDLPGTTFRHEEFAEYKSHRIKAPDELYLQIPYIKEILTSFGIPIFEKAGFEADDLIGSLARHTRDMEDIQVVIMTGDLDTLQLVQDDKVVVFTLRKGVTDTFIYNEKEVKARYDLKPAQIIDFKGLKGDPSDNIPGVPGVGDKTASSLVKQFGSIEGIYEAIEKKGSDSKIENPRFANRAKREANRDKKPKLLTPKLIEKLETNKDQALFSKRLATIICDVDFEFDFDKTEWRKHMAREQLEKLLKDLALFSLVKRLDEIDGEAKSAPVVRPAAAGPTAAGQLLDSDSAVESALAGIEKSGQAAIDIQAGLILATNDGKEAFGFPETMLKGKLKEKFSDILTNPRIEKTFCDEKEICRWALERGMELQDCSFDIHLAAYLINSDIHDFSLERLYFAEFEHDMSAEPLYRPIALAKLRERYQSKLSALGLEKVFKTIELPLGPILAGMEQKGIKIDREAIKKLSVEIDKELAELEKQIYGHAGSPFNISSPKQLSTILFEKLAIKGKVRKTGKGAISTAAGELEKLIEEHPIIALILKYRELQKLKTTYIEPFPSLIAADGRLHTTYNQNGAVTGRLSSQDPNLQNIPIKTELGQKFRSAFIADNGFKLLSLDYSQLELRIVAHISGDQAMTEAFRTGLDIHTRTAAAIFKVKPDQVTANMRRQAKVLNFGLIYGMGVLGFQRASGVDRDTAREFIDNYMAEFSGVARYMKEIKEQAHKDGYVSTIFGRRRQLPEINSGMPQLVATAERMAINMPVQGTEADLLKLAMIDVQKLIDEKYGDNVRMLLQVHDELLFEVKEDMVAEAAKDIRETMETAHKFDVPIVVDAKVGDNWSEMQKIKENN